VQRLHTHFRGISSTVSVIITTMDSRLVLGLMLLGACDARLSGGLTSDGGDDNGSSDGSNNNAGSDGGTDGQTMLGPWGTPTKVPGASSAADEDDATLSSSRLELYFKRNDSGNQNLYVMTRPSQADDFGLPVALTVLNSSVDEESPRLSQDDLTLYFGRGGDIYKSTRTVIGGAWGAATAVTALNTSTQYEKWAAVCSNGYAMVSRSVSNEGQNLFEGTISGGANTAVTQLNSTSGEQGTFLSNDCLRVYFQSNRDGQFNIYVATRVTMTTAWSNPTALPDFNTNTFSEEDPWISADQRTFVFSSNSAGNKDVYISTR
jgi:hypothetical protein